MTFLRNLGPENTFHGVEIEEFCAPCQAIIRDPASMGTAESSLCEECVAKVRREVATGIRVYIAIGAELDRLAETLGVRPREGASESSHPETDVELRGRILARLGAMPAPGPSPQPGFVDPLGIPCPTHKVPAGQVCGFLDGDGAACCWRICAAAPPAPPPDDLTIAVQSARPEQTNIVLSVMPNGDVKVSGYDDPRVSAMVVRDEHAEPGALRTIVVAVSRDGRPPDMVKAGDAVEAVVDAAKDG